MCWHVAVAQMARGAVDAVKDTAPAVGAVGAAQVGGAVLGAPSWLLGLGQAVIVVFFTLRGVDRRQRQRDQERDADVKELRGEVSTLAGRINGLGCIQAGRPALTPCPPSLSLGSE